MYRYERGTSSKIPEQGQAGILKKNGGRNGNVAQYDAGTDGDMRYHLSVSLTGFPSMGGSVEEVIVALPPRPAKLGSLNNTSEQVLSLK